MNTWVPFLIAVATSALATRAMLAYARRNLIDEINERSSHKVPTPRGGGLGVIIGVLVGMLPQIYWDELSVHIGLLGLALVGMSALGWWDDHANLSASKRLPAQLALIGVICLVSGFPSQITFIGSWQINVSLWWYIPVAILGGGWLVNLTNFMDGIDGIAGIQGVIGSLGLFVMLPPEAEVSRLLLMSCAGACSGFLIWNWPPAKIFMGDVGSTTLGLVFAIGVIEGLRHGVTLELLILPLAPFVADATCTLTRRAWKRERLTQAHRSHLYQRLALWWGGHRPVTILYGVYALLGLVLSITVQHGYLPSGLGVLVWLVLWVLLVGFAHRVCNNCRPIN